jgi:hypothetical protein
VQPAHLSEEDVSLPDDLDDVDPLALLASRSTKDRISGEVSFNVLDVLPSTSRQKNTIWMKTRLFWILRHLDLDYEILKSILMRWETPSITLLGQIHHSKLTSPIKVALLMETSQDKYTWFSLASQENNTEQVLLQKDVVLNTICFPAIEASISDE